MFYCILTYDSEAVVMARTKRQDEALAERQRQLQHELAGQGRLGAAVRLMRTTTAVTIRPGRRPEILDGPCTETKEQLFGLYIVDCATLDQAIETARRIGECSLSPDSGTLEIRPIAWLGMNGAPT